MGDIRERDEVGGLVYGIGADGLGEYAECYDGRTGERLEIQGPCLDPGLVRFILAAMKVANNRDADVPPYGRRRGS